MRVRILLTVLIAAGVLALTPGPYPGQTQPQTRPASRPLYRVFNRDNKPGFIDKTGRLVIGFDRFPGDVSIQDFHEGLAVICFLNRDRHSCLEIGYIDQNGENENDRLPVQSRG